MFYASELACLAAQLQPIGAAHVGADTVCAMCGRPITSGMPSARLDFGKSFQNHHWLTHSDHQCGWCAQVQQQNVLRAFQRCVVTPHGVYNIGTDAARGWLWTNPPEPPFVIVINSNTTAAFHYIWRTPVTLDRRLLMVNFDGTVVAVRPEAIGKALECAEILRAAATAAGHAKTSFTPFQVLLRDAFNSQEAGHGQFSRVTQELAMSDPACRVARDYLASLWRGELVALASLLKKKPVPPLMPPLLAGAALFTKTNSPDASD